MSERKWKLPSRLACAVEFRGHERVYVTNGRQEGALLRPLGHWRIESPCGEVLVANLPSEQAAYGEIIRLKG